MSDGEWQTAGGSGGQVVEPSFEDPEGYVDGITNDELMPDVMGRAPREADGIENVVIISNIPKTAKVDKLKDKLAKMWTEKAGVPVTAEYPVETLEDGSQQTKGYCFLEFEDEETALKAADELNDYKFDRKHTFSANLFTDFEKFERTEDEWVEPTRKPFDELGDLYQHMQDEDSNDQFVVTYDEGRMTQTFLNKRPEVQSVFERKGWSQRGIDFSPTGKFVSTYHEQGIALWVYTPHLVGASESKAKGVWSRSHKFRHDQVDNLQFSPNERYIVTGNGGRGDAPSTVIVHDVLSMSEKRKFTVPITSESGQMDWPHLKWSHDSRFFLASNYRHHFRV